MTEKSRGDRRAETARLNDDSELIEESKETRPGVHGQQGREGGNLQRDVGTQAEEQRVKKPRTRESVTKSDHIAHGQHSDEPRPAEQVVTKRD